MHNQPEPATGLRLETAQGVATIIIDRPERKNAITHAMWCELARMVTEAAGDPGTRCLVIRGEGHDFSAGADIGEFDEVRRDAATARAYEADNSRAFSAVRNAAVPTIAAIDGVCFGGGFGVAAACDLRIATHEARFSVPAARLGLAYPQDAMIDIVHASGPQLARYLAYSAAVIDAEAALRTGFLLEIAPAAYLAERATALATQIAANAPLSIRASKAAIHAVLTGNPKDAEEARRLGAATFDSADYAEGRAAFRDRRKPLFRGN